MSFFISSRKVVCLFSVMTAAGLFTCQSPPEDTSSYFPAPPFKNIPPLSDPSFSCKESVRTQLQWGTSNPDWAHAVILDENRYLYLVGFEQLTGDQIPFAGAGKAWVRKYKPSGDLMWEKTFDSGAATSATSILLDKETQSLYILGKTMGAFTGFTHQANFSEGGFDPFVIKMNLSDGKILKALQFGNQRSYSPKFLKMDVQGGLWVTGEIDRYPDGTLPQLEKPFVARIDKSLVWKEKSSFLRPLFSNLYVTSISLVGHLTTHPGPDLAAYIVGMNSGTDHEGNDVSGGFISKVSMDGTVLWTNRSGTDPYEPVMGATISPLNELWVTGAGYPLTQKKGGLDAFVAKIDLETQETGDIQHRKDLPVFGTKDHEIPTTSIAFDTKRNMYIAGYTLGSFLPGKEVVNGSHLFVVQLDPQGKLLKVWQKESPSGRQGTRIQSIAVDACDQIIIVGYTNQKLFSEHNHVGKEDAFLIRLWPEDFVSIP